MDKEKIPGACLQMIIWNYIIILEIILIINKPKRVANQPTNQWTLSQTINQTINPPTHQPTNPATNQPNKNQAPIHPQKTIYL